MKGATMFMKCSASLLIIFLVTSCATTNGFDSSNCGPNIFDRNGYPCWINKSPNEGIVINMAEHADRNKTREFLFKKALLEIAAAKGGVDISEDAIVKKRTQVTGSDNVRQSAQVVSLATVKTANGSVTVKAKINDYWQDPQTRRAYMWVIPVN